MLLQELVGRLNAVVREACCSTCRCNKPQQAGLRLVTTVVKMHRFRSRKQCFWITFLIGSLRFIFVAPNKGFLQQLAGGVEFARERRNMLRYHVDKTAGGVINQMLCHIGAFLSAYSFEGRGPTLSCSQSEPPAEHL